MLKEIPPVKGDAAPPPTPVPASGKSRVGRSISIISKTLVFVKPRADKFDKPGGKMMAGCGAAGGALRAIEALVSVALPRSIWPNCSCMNVI